MACVLMLAFVFIATVGCCFPSSLPLGPLPLPLPLPLAIPSFDFAAGVWSSFRSLLDAEKGFISDTISELKSYFLHFGYLSLAEGELLSGEFDSATEDAVKLYQASFGLPVTGILDVFTVLKLMQPRCGREDVINGAPMMANRNGSKRFSHFPGNPKWITGSNITYAFSATNQTFRVSETQIKAEFSAAFAQWSSCIPVTFTEIEHFHEADVQIGFLSYDHGDGDPFDGVLGILAHAFAPEDGRFHLDDAEFWTVNVATEKSMQAIDLQTVVLHEIGHLLGLGHSWDEDSVMYPSILPRLAKHELSEDDIEGARALYGTSKELPLHSPAAIDQPLQHSAADPSPSVSASASANAIYRIVSSSFSPSCLLLAIAIAIAIAIAW